MSERPKYTKEAAFAVISELEQVIKGRKDTYDTPVEFMNRHPWTKKFVCVGYSEVEQLFHESKKPEFSIDQIPVGDIELGWRKRNGKMVPLRFGYTGQGANIRFIFDQIEKEIYTPVTGTFESH